MFSQRNSIRSLLLLCGFLFSLSFLSKADTHYVATNGPGPSPYTSWETAASNIQWAVDTATAGDTVLVSNGTYYLTNQINILAAITCASVNGRSVTIVNGNYPNYTNRCFSITNATLDGFTISNGYFDCVLGGTIYAGGGIHAYNALIKNCAIVNNVASNVMISPNHAWGGGARLYSSSISNCIVSGNRVLAFYSRGGGICAEKSTISVCTIDSNQCFGDGFRRGAGVMIEATSGEKLEDNSLGYNIGDNAIMYADYGNSIFIRNCLVHHNTGCGIAGWSGLSRITIQNCTIVSNVGTTCGGLNIGTVNAKTTIVENVVSYWNVGTVSNFAYLGGTGVLHIINSCIAPTSSFPSAGAGLPTEVYYTNNIESNPRFVNKDADDWRLSPNSPCLNAGTNQDWMTNAVDLDKRLRIRYGTVDMGAYECIYEGTIYRLGI